MKSNQKNKLYLLTLLLPLLFLNLLSREIKAELQVAQAFSNLTFDRPVDLQNAGDGSNRLFVVEQGGLIKSFINEPSVETTTTVLNITSKILSEGERGLLALAFHPKFSSNGYIFVNYTRAPDGATVISRFQVVDGVANPSSEVIMLRVAQPYSNHNGGQIFFGKEGLLYISLGDGGSANDPENRAQNRRSLLGKILRINIDKKEAGKNYAIPKTNPFIRSKSYKREIFAYGFRNPWKVSQDPVTGLIWAADVGQSKFEEINLVRNGKNYGWRYFEGNSKNVCRGSTCRLTTIRPVYTYSRSVGQSITGGYVYRGTKISELAGKYVFADFIAGKIFTLSNLNNKFVGKQIFTTSSLISTFGVDEAKELYFCGYGEGKIYKFIN